ncbi:hypothetical protein sos41_30600 [Alphaproteobacteria bacterium SO-S41]|nr:hypothetical protein sos41_30600 [Alphaproteobacteria bacterium SO-S41]
MSDTTVTVRPRRRWPLYASLFINVVLLTVLALGAWRVHQFRNAMGDGGMGGFWLPRQIERALPDGARDKVRKIREAHAAELRPLFLAAGTARDGVRDAVDAEPFDGEKLRAALKTMRDADAAVAEATGEMVIEIANALTPEERGRVRQAMRDRRPGKDDRGPGGPGGPGRRGGPDETPPPGGAPGPDGAMPPPPPPPEGEPPPPPPTNP